jgi:hypothetical protein
MFTAGRGHLGGEWLLRMRWYVAVRLQ